MFERRTHKITLVVILALACTVLLLGTAYWVHKNVLKPISQTDKLAKQLKHDTRELRADIIDGMIADKVETITNGLQNDQEMAIAVARWIAANLTNSQLSIGRDVYSYFVERSAYCGGKSRLFVKMLGVNYIHAKVFRMFNAAPNGTSHVCAQAWYNGKWHFFDCTYAGYFLRNGDVLSWDEIINLPESARWQALVVMDTNLRFYTGPELEPEVRIVDSVDMMHRAYAQSVIDKLKHNQSYGFFRSPVAKNFVVEVNESALDKPLILGKVNQSYQDVNEQGKTLLLSDLLGESIGTIADKIRTIWTLYNCKPGDVLGLQYQLYQPRKKTVTLQASGSGAEILEGQKFFIEEGRFPSKDAVWRIKARVNAAGTCKIIVESDAPADVSTGALVDQIKLSRERP
ncbi:MAG: transglutaminase-like domain-containing protein [Deltaproteobacteria bacterium]|nr:transglutaminase-like domain-containing protein [Deltaproteobacteria bacterium]